MLRWELVAGARLPWYSPTAEAEGGRHEENFEAGQNVEGEKRRGGEHPARQVSQADLV